MAGHPIVHVEIAAKDPKAASKFYADLFGWKIQHDAQFNYYMFAAEGGPGGGWVDGNDPMYKGVSVIPYIDTDDIDGMLKRIEALGGKTLTPKTEIPGMGWFAFFADPSGNHMGLYTSTQPQGQ